MGEIDDYLMLAQTAVSTLSVIAKKNGDLPTMYAANKAWHELFKARDDLDRRRERLKAAQ